jgi:hypothetical protein
MFQMQIGHGRGNGNSVRLNVNIPGAESIQTEPISCHSVTVAEGYEPAEIHGRIYDVYHHQENVFQHVHNNTYSHMAHNVQHILLSMDWKVFNQLSYSPELSECQFHEFGPLKKAQKGRTFGSDKNVKATVVLWFQQQKHKRGLCRGDPSLGTCLPQNP